MPEERLLVNHLYAHNVGHAIEALHACHGHHLADPERRVSVLLNAATPVELAGWCPFLDDAYAVEHPLLEPCPDAAARLGHVPREWDWVLDDPRRHDPGQLALFPGLRDFHAAADVHLRGRRDVERSPRAGYVRHAALRLVLPDTERAAAARVLDLGDRGGGAIALLPAGSSEAALYPSARSWTTILDALCEAHPGLQVVLVGRRAGGGRTATSLSEDGLQALLAHPCRPIDRVDRPLVEQLAAVEACDAFLAPHSGFGMAALAVGTPWLALSGGRWFEYFFNHVPFRSVVPDTERFAAFTQFDAPPVLGDDEGDGPRTPSMSGARVRADLDRIVRAAGELLAGTVPYEQALEDYFTDLLTALGGRRDALWSIDDVHRDVLNGAPAR